MLGALFRVEADPGKVEELIAHLKWAQPEFRGPNFPKADSRV